MSDFSDTLSKFKQDQLLAPSIETALHELEGVIGSGSHVPWSDLTALSIPAKIGRLDFLGTDPDRVPDFRRRWADVRLANLKLPYLEERNG